MCLLEHGNVGMMRGPGDGDVPVQLESPPRPASPPPPLPNTSHKCPPEAPPDRPPRDTPLVLPQRQPEARLSWRASGACLARMADPFRRTSIHGGDSTCHALQCPHYALNSVHAHKITELWRTHVGLGVRMASKSARNRSSIWYSSRKKDRWLSEMLTVQENPCKDSLVSAR